MAHRKVVCMHGHNEDAGCRVCGPHDWRDLYERRAYGPFDRLPGSERATPPTMPELDTFDGASGIVKHDGRKGE